jgi:hypothetical protein
MNKREKVSHNIKFGINISQQQMNHTEVHSRPVFLQRWR